MEGIQCNLHQLYEISVFVHLFWTGMCKKKTPFFLLVTLTKLCTQVGNCACSIMMKMSHFCLGNKLRIFTILIFSSKLLEWEGFFKFLQSSSGACSCRVKLGRHEQNLQKLTSRRARGMKPQILNVWVMFLIYLWKSGYLRLAAF